MRCRLCHRFGMFEIYSNIHPRIKKHLFRSLLIGGVGLLALGAGFWIEGGRYNTVPGATAAFYISSAIVLLFGIFLILYGIYLHATRR